MYFCWPDKTTHGTTVPLQNRWVGQLFILLKRGFLYQTSRRQNIRCRGLKSWNCFFLTSSSMSNSYVGTWIRPFKYYQIDYNSVTSLGLRITSSKSVKTWSLWGWFMYSIEPLDEAWYTLQIKIVHFIVDSKILVRYPEAGFIARTFNEGNLRRHSSFSKPIPAERRQ